MIRFCSARSPARPSAKHRATVALLMLVVGSPALAQQRESVAPENMQAIAPALADYTDDILYGMSGSASN